MLRVAVVVLALAVVATPASSQQHHVDSRLKSEHLSRATEWFATNGLNLEQFTLASQTERARAATYLAWEHCVVGDDTPDDLNDLYAHCVTTCGGITYVAEGFAEAMGLRTRRANLYNIPQQGNHTALEILVNGRWSFFDPTFGAFFTENGEADDRALGLWEVAKATDIESHVVQATREGVDKALSTAIWSGVFDHPFMDLRNYQIAETITQGDPEEVLFLNIPIRNGESIGKLLSTDRAELSKGWLDYTNGTLRDEIRVNDTSYASYLISNSGAQRTTIVTIKKVDPRQSGCLSVRFYNPHTRPQYLQVGGLGKFTTILSDRYLVLDPGASLEVINYKSDDEFAQLYFRNIDSGITEMFALKAAC